jgi:hypothetical protein
MIFTDPSGDEGIHPVSLITFPSVVPPPTRGEVVHRTAYSVITYSQRKKQKRTKSLEQEFEAPIEVEHLHSKVKELLDDGSGSSVDKTGNQIVFMQITPKVKRSENRTTAIKSTKFMNDGSALLKQEIQNSEERVYRVKAGKALSYLFPLSKKQFVGPNKSLYNRQKLGTPGYSNENKELLYSGRRQQVSLMNSSPQKPFLMLPSLKEILLNNEQSQEGIFEAGSDLTQKFEKLEKSLTKRNRKDARMVVEGHEKNLINIVKNHLKSEKIKDVLTNDPISHLMERFREFDNGKEKLKNKLTDILSTQKYDRPETIWLKYKHFKTSEKASVYQGRMVDIWNMRMEAEKERLEQNRGMMSQVCWYRDILWFTIEKCNDISPYTYYILDYIKALTEECVEVTKSLMQKAFENIPHSERTNGINLLMSKILIDLSAQFNTFVKSDNIIKK